MEVGARYLELSLVWPEINLIRLCSHGRMALLCTVNLAYVLGYYHSQSDNSQSYPTNRGNKIVLAASRPVPPVIYGLSIGPKILQILNKDSTFTTPLLIRRGVYCNYGTNLVKLPRIGRINNLQS